MIDPLFAVAQRLSGFSEADVEALTKNSEQPTEESELSTELCPIVGCTVEELRDRISERELIAWQVYWTIEPPLADRIEIAIGILASLMANINRDAKRRAEPFEPRDFMVDWLGRLEEKPEQEGMSPEEILSAFDRLIRAQELRYGTR